MRHLKYAINVINYATLKFAANLNRIARCGSRVWVSQQAGGECPKGYSPLPVSKSGKFYCDTVFPANLSAMASATRSPSIAAEVMPPA